MGFAVSIIVCLVVVVFVILAKAKKGQVSADEKHWPFYAKKPLSSPELVLYFRLCKALPESIVLAQVALSRILGVKQGNNFGEWFNRVNRMSVDFAICSKDSTILAIIELDDASHERADRRAADAKKDKALNAAGIRIVRWHVKSIPDEVAIKAIFANVQRDMQNPELTPSTAADVSLRAE